jgi:ribosomal protein S18 acetylase RimI-like enzyme
MDSSMNRLAMRAAYGAGQLSRVPWYVGHALTLGNPRHYSARPTGEILGGLWGRIGYNFFFVEIFALGAARGHGLGRRLMGMAEAEALKRNLSGLWLDTWSFQAPDFYRKLGFEECGRITDYPPGHDRIFFVKRLPQGRTPA